MSDPVQIPYGTIFTEGDVIAGMRAVLEQHYPGALASAAAQHGLDPDDVPAPRGYGASVNLDSITVDTPIGIIVCPGMIGRPTPHADGTYEARFEVGAAIALRAKTDDAAQALCNLHVGALRAAVLQHKKLGGIAQDTIWTDSRPERIAQSDSVAVWSATSVFEVVVTAVFDGWATAGPNPIIETRDAVRVDIRRQ